MMSYDIILVVPSSFTDPPHPTGEPSPHTYTIRDIFVQLNSVLLDSGLNSTVMDMESWSTNVSCGISVGVGGDKPATGRGRITGQIMRHQKKTGNRHIVVDRGYIYKRREYWSVGWDDLNGRANFCNQNMDDSRINDWGIKLKPWKTNDGGFVLFCLQLPWDAAVNNTNYSAYIKNTVDTLLLSTDREIVLREHPLISMGRCSQLPIAHKHRDVVDNLVDYRVKNNRVRMSKNASIEDDFDQAWCVVAYNSNSTVDATLQGIPSFVADEGSMTWNISRHDLDIENPINPGRYQWLCDLSYTQWSNDELSKGLPFKQLGVIL